MLNKHFSGGGYYPVGGASEIALNAIPVIERAGGRVLVRADVTDILVDGSSGAAVGVRVRKGSEDHIVAAKAVISSAGLYNTFNKLLPKHVAAKSYYTGICKELKPATAAMSVFVGLDASNEALGLTSTNVWAFSDPAAAMDIENYASLTSEEALSKDVPLLFISFPSTKDPNWKQHPGRADKATCALVTLAPWEWFSQWDKGRRREAGGQGCLAGQGGKRSQWNILEFSRG